MNRKNQIFHLINECIAENIDLIIKLWKIAKLTWLVFYVIILQKDIICNRRENDNKRHKTLFRVSKHSFYRRQRFDRNARYDNLI